MTEPSCKFCGGFIIDEYGRACCRQAAEVIIFGEGTLWPKSIGGILEEFEFNALDFKAPSFIETLRDAMR